MHKLILILFLISTHTIALSQADSSYPTPEFAKQPYYFDQLNKQLIPLEKAIAKMNTKINVMGRGSMSYVIEQPNSRVTLVASNRSQFIITDLPSALMDPTAMMPLYRIKSGKKQREIPMPNGGQTNESNKIDYELKKAGEKYIFVVIQPLPPGEYAFVNMMSMGQGQSLTAYCFRVQ